MKEVPENCTLRMANFMKCCFPSVHVDDDEVELVSIDAIHPKRSRHNDRLKANISRPRPQHGPRIQVPPPVANPRNTYPTMRRRSLQGLQDLVDDHGEPQQDNISAVVFNARDRAHGHVLRDLNAALRHSKWAVSGSFAEALWGCASGKRKDTLSILCSASSRTTTKVWLTSQSLFTVASADGNVLEYQGDTAGSAPIFVRIRWVSDRELERLGSIDENFKYREGPLKPVTIIAFVLLSLPSLADNLALSWVKATDPRVKRDFSADLFAVLDRIVQLDFAMEGTGPLNEAHNVHIMHHTFWQPFTAAYPDSPALFAQCGLPLSNLTRTVITQPPQQNMQMSFEQPSTFQKPRKAPVPPSTAYDQGRNLTAPSSKHHSHTRSSSSSRPSSHSKSSSSSKPLSSKSSSSSRHKKSSSRSPSKSRHPSSSGSKLNTFVCRSTNDDIPAGFLSPKRPVHPANILPPAPESRSKVSAFLGFGVSKEEIERLHLEQLEQDREARRMEEALAAKIQRNRVRDREREWHTRKQSERMAKENTWPGL